MPIDNPDVKIVEARYKGKPFVVGVGTSERREVKGSGKVGLQEGVKGEYESQKSLKWDVLFNPKALPDFIPIEKAKDLATSTVAVTGSTLDVYATDTRVSEIKPEELGKIRNILAKTKTMTMTGSQLFEAVRLAIDEQMQGTAETVVVVPKKLGKKRTIRGK